ncbi:MAG: adenosine kinase [Bacteroidales bacterium]|jgi:sugar/nucleoside kinase (ribokinase family)|nr:adenosine kinase [Bacteroidales bacterium]
MQKILGIGNALVDVLVEIRDESVFQKFGLKKGGMEMINAELKNEINKEIKSLKQTVASGGSTSNTIYGLAQLGAPTGYIGKIGKDDKGLFFRNDMEKIGVNTHLSYSNIDTGIATTFITQCGERTFATYLGAAATQTSEDLSEEIFSQYNIIHVEGYLIFNRELVLNICKLAKKCGLKISMDMASYNLVEAMHPLINELLRDYVDIIFANEEEAFAFTGKKEREALEILSSYCPVSVIKLGAEGSLANINGETTVIPAVKANCKDTTGAGDIFAAGFLYGLINDYPISLAGAIASKLGAKCVETIGARIITH